MLELFFRGEARPFRAGLFRWTAQKHQETRIDRALLQGFQETRINQALLQSTSISPLITLIFF
jgi:hypothetical protein